LKTKKTREAKSSFAAVVGHVGDGFEIAVDTWAVKGRILEGQSFFKRFGGLRSFESVFDVFSHN
jgi:hypothetical protein